MEKKKTLWPLIFIPLILGVIVGFIVSGARDTYASLNLPPLSPPAAIFPIVWGILYLLMGAALYLVVSSDVPDSEKFNAIWYFILQFMLNLIWPVIFFRFETYWAAAVVLILMIKFSILTFLVFKSINKTAAYLLIPYILWQLYALYLNVGVSLLN